MGSLEDKLRDLQLTDEHIVSIKAIFADDPDWVYLLAKENSGNHTRRMTGQEWYDRFNRELDEMFKYEASMVSNPDRDTLEEAAKKASGI